MWGPYRAIKHFYTCCLRTNLADVAAVHFHLYVRLAPLFSLICPKELYYMDQPDWQHVQKGPDPQQRWEPQEFKARLGLLLKVLQGALQLDAGSTTVG